MRILLKLLGAIVGLYALVCIALFVVMSRSPDIFAATMKHVPDPAFMFLPFRSLWMNARSGNVRPGEYAPDFVLKSTDHRESFRLSSLRGKQPVVLVFGSYT